MTDDWTHEGLPPLGSRAHVWFGGTNIRSVERDWCGLLWFRDCTHPAQNALCGNVDDIMAWRLLDGHISPPPTGQMQADNAAMSQLARLFQNSPS